MTIRKIDPHSRARQNVKIQTVEPDDSSDVTIVAMTADEYRWLHDLLTFISLSATNSEAGGIMARNIVDKLC